MQEQARRLREPLPWGRREKTAIAVLLSCTALALVGLVVYGLTSGSPSRRDCIDVTFASTLGGAALKGCGEHARAVCAHGATFSGSVREDLRRACARAGFAFKG